MLAHGDPSGRIPLPSPRGADASGSLAFGMNCMVHTKSGIDETDPKDPADRRSTIRGRH